MQIKTTEILALQSHNKLEILFLRGTFFFFWRKFLVADLFVIGSYKGILRYPPFLLSTQQRVGHTTPNFFVELIYNLCGLDHRRNFWWWDPPSPVQTYQLLNNPRPAQLCPTKVLSTPIYFNCCSAFNQPCHVISELEDDNNKDMTPSYTSHWPKKVPSPLVTKFDLWYLPPPAYSISLNSLTATSVLAGTKNSHPEGFWLAKHTAHKHPHHVEPFPPQAAWFWWTNISHPREPLQKGLAEAAVEGF
jgi:hypothetical protein